VKRHGKAGVIWISDKERYGEAHTVIGTACSVVRDEKKKLL
jgi:hypothetical protein